MAKFLERTGKIRLMFRSHASKSLLIRRFSSTEFRETCPAEDEIIPASLPWCLERAGTRRMKITNIKKLNVNETARSNLGKSRHHW